MPVLDELRKLRKYNELTCQDMADLLGIEARTYINKENGLSQFKLNEMFLICKKFKRSLDEIFLPKNFMIHEVEEDENATT